MTPGPRKEPGWVAYGTLTLAVAGALWFGLLSWLSQFVYRPLDVRPSEVGLDSQVLTQTAAGVIFAGLIVVLLGVGISGALWLRLSHRKTLDGAKWRSRSMIVMAGVFGVVAIVVLFTMAIVSRNELGDGKTPNSLWNLNPWRATVVTIHSSKAPSSLTCVLYLGQADSVSVFYDHAGSHVFRIPTSDADTVATPHTRTCP